MKSLVIVTHIKRVGIHVIFLPSPPFCIMYHHLIHIRYLFIPFSFRFLNISGLNNLHFTISNIQSTKLAFVIILKYYFFFILAFEWLPERLNTYCMILCGKNNKWKCFLRSTGNILGTRVGVLNNTERFRILGVCFLFSPESHLLNGLPLPLICTRLCVLSVVYHQPLVFLAVTGL